MTKARSSLMIFAFILGNATPLLARSDSLNESVIQSRIAGFKEMSVLTKSIRDGLASNIHSTDDHIDAAKQMVVYAEQIHLWFPEGTDTVTVNAASAKNKKEVGFLDRLRSKSASKTRALPRIWESPIDFDSKADRLASLAVSLTATLESGSGLDANSTIQLIQKSCRACHEVYRRPDD